MKNYDIVLFTGQKYKKQTNKYVNLTKNKTNKPIKSIKIQTNN
jgi:hypothetical protein